MWDKLGNMAKGATWGLVILLLIYMCQGCQSSRLAERILASEQEGVRVTKSGDSIDYAMLVRTIKSLMVDIQTGKQTETINYSEPDELGVQHITSIERTQSTQNTKIEKKDTQELAAVYKQTQMSIDSLRQRVSEIEQTQEDTQETSGGILGWSGDEALAVLVIILLIVVCWIIGKKLL